MILYRITRDKYAKDLSGKGGQVSTARWHDHAPIIYTSVSSSAAILEKLVYMQSNEIHHDLMLMSIIVPDQCSSEEIDILQLPEGWNKYPGPALLKRIGNAWLSRSSSLLLFVPSVIDPLAKNVLINPLHAEARQISIGKIQSFRFDDRLLK